MRRLRRLPEERTKEGPRAGLQLLGLWVVKFFEKERNEEKNAGVASLRGQGTPAYPARLRSERARNSLKNISYDKAVQMLQIQPADFFAAAADRNGDFPSRRFYFSSSPRRNS